MNTEKQAIPTHHFKLLSRSHLVQRLQEGIHKKCTLVSAPAGFGKTTLISEWVKRAQIPVLWISLDPKDNDPTRFASYMQWNDMASPLLLVFDNYHYIENEAVHQAVTYMIQHSGKHVVLISQTEPPIPLHQLRVQREINELLASDLRFTEEETSQLFNQIRNDGLSTHNEAIEHALWANNLDSAYELIYDYSPLILKNRQLLTLRRWIAFFPSEYMEEKPFLYLLLAWVEGLSHHVDPAEKQIIYFENAINGHMNHLSESEYTELRAEYYVVCCYLSILRGEVEEALHHIEQAIQLNPFVSRFFQTGIAINSGEAYFIRSDSTLSGQLKPMAKLYVNFRRLLKKRGLPIVAYGSVTLAELHYEWNQFDEAEYFIHRGIGLGKDYHLIDILVPIYITYVRLKRVQGQRREMWSIVYELGEVLMRENASSHWYSILMALKARLWLDEGDSGKLKSWMTHSQLSIHDPISAINEYQFLTLARVLIHLQQEQQALMLLDQLYLFAEQERRLASMIEILVVKSLLFYTQKELQQALSTLKRALILAAPHEYKRTFLDEGEALAHLLSMIDEGKDGVQQDSALQSYVQDLLLLGQKEYNLQLPEDRKGKAVGFYEPLTKRELDVLSSIAEGLTNKEIADKFGLTLGTVKGYTVNIFNKLEVHNRTQALLKAKKLKILSQI